MIKLNKLLYKFGGPKHQEFISFLDQLFYELNLRSTELIRIRLLFLINIRISQHYCGINYTGGVKNACRENGFKALKGEMKRTVFGNYGAVSDLLIVIYV